MKNRISEKMKDLKKLFIMQLKENKEVEHIREKGS